jgi:flagellar biogenesis protein FliO
MLLDGVGIWGSIAASSVLSVLWGSLLVVMAIISVGRWVLVCYVWAHSKGTTAVTAVATMASTVVALLLASLL